MCPLGVFRLRTTRVRGPGPSPCSPLLSLGLFLASLYSEIIFPPLPPRPASCRGSGRQCSTKNSDPAAPRILSPRQLVVGGILLGIGAGEEPTCGRGDLGATKKPVHHHWSHYYYCCCLSCFIPAPTKSGLGSVIWPAIRGLSTRGQPGVKLCLKLTPDAVPADSAVSSPRKRRTSCPCP